MPDRDETSPREALEREFPIVQRVEVRWGDMDAFQHVNNTLYFRYFEHVRIGYFLATIQGGAEEAGLPAGAGPIMHSTSCRFRAPVKYPDTLFVGTRVSSIGRDRFTMQYRAVSEKLGRVVADGEAIIVSFDYSRGSKVELPESWISGIEDVEATVGNTPERLDD